MKKLLLLGSGVVPIPPQFGGATELIIYEISRAMPKSIYEVHVLDRRDNNAKEENISGAKYIRIAAPKAGNIFLLRLTELIFGIRALSRIRKIKPDAVHANTVFSALPAALMKCTLPGKLIYTCHNPAWADDSPDIFNRLIRKLELFIMKRADAVTTVSGTMKERIAESGIPSGKITVIYNFVDTAEFRPGKQEKDRVFFVSKLSANKGVECLIRAADVARKEIPGIKFIIGGPVSFEHNAENPWEKLAKDLELQGTIEFPGKISRKDLPWAYSSSSLFCFPTLKESFGIVIAEAMASGLPVITSDIPVVREVCGGACILVRPRDEKALAKEIVALLKDKKMQHKYSGLSLKRSKAFSMDRIMKDYEKFYSRTL